jgi:hypothetical protein
VVVLTASIAGYEGQIGQIPYASSKAGVIGMAIVAARDLASKLIRVCTIAPGIMDTPMLARLPDNIKQSLGASVPNPARLGMPEEYASLAMHIVQNAYLNGETIRIDGALRMESVGSDIVIKGINGNCQILDIGGDLLLDAPFELPSEHHYASVSGDVVIRIQPNANVSITIPEDVERNIQSRGAQILTSDAETTITLGDGLTEIKIDDISGDFLLQSHNDGRFNGIFDLAENLTDNLIDGLRAGQGWSWEDLSERAHRDAERVRRDAERVAREAERGIRDALRGQEQAERKKNKIEFSTLFLAKMAQI